MESSPPPINQIVLLDGTFASLTQGRRSSIARIHALLSGDYGPLPAPVGLCYEPGQQWEAWRTLPQLAMGAGLLLGRVVPGLNTALDAVKVDQTSLPIAIGLFAMMYPVLARVKYEDIGHLTGDRRMLWLSLILNWLIEWPTGCH